MRIMDEKDLQHIRVLNLSDIIRSSRFLNNFPVDEPDEPDGPTIPAHSIFCLERDAELQCRLNSRLNIIIAGWSKEWDNQTRTRQHAEQCHSRIENIIENNSTEDQEMRILGVCDPDHRYLYGYPFLPMNPKRTFDWLNHVLSEWPED